jgi:hypothetical protein
MKHSTVERLKRVRPAKGVVGPDRLLTWEFSMHYLSKDTAPKALGQGAFTAGTGDSAISDLVCTRLAQ